MSFYPQPSRYLKPIESRLKAFAPTAVDIRYRDTTGGTISTKAFTVNKLKFDLSSGYAEQIFGRSARFKLGNDVFIDRSGSAVSQCESCEW